ncbi:hypothetical protein [Nocardia aurantia]|uniref:hypothetical protein n=1 Tax=Nocardia aurantia TaxID=2585199 RepID=UPI0012974244|nr:hypothetical protein [Nocardia aurantia]
MITRFREIRHPATGTALFDLVVDRRKALWRGYARALIELEGPRLVDVDIDNTVPFNLVVRVRDRDQVFTRLKAAGIGSSPREASVCTNDRGRNPSAQGEGGDSEIR